MKEHISRKDGGGYSIDYLSPDLSLLARHLHRLPSDAMSRAELHGPLLDPPSELLPLPEDCCEDIYRPIILIKL